MLQSTSRPGVGCSLEERVVRRMKKDIIDPKGYDILTVGFPMVEIMRKERGVPFEEPGDFTGPYPSGDTCILLDVAARLGKKCCFLGVTGDGSALP